MDEREKIERARLQVAAMTGFYVHFAIFAVVIAILAVINLAYSSVWWVQWPLLGWGIGVLGHALIVFGSTPTFIQDWQRRKVHELKQKM
ncbi:MAG: 2TM domain-containing protein [Hyphomicrobiaceae bacterium]